MKSLPRIQLFNKNQHLLKKIILQMIKTFYYKTPIIPSSLPPFSIYQFFFSFFFFMFTFSLLLFFFFLLIKKNIQFNGKLQILIFMQNNASLFLWKDFFLLSFYNRLFVNKSIRAFLLFIYQK